MLSQLLEYLCYFNIGPIEHPVGTLAMGAGNASVTNTLQVRGVDGLWVADASVMPSITLANTTAPSMMIGYRATKLMLNDVKN